MSKDEDPDDDANRGGKDSQPCKEEADSEAVNAIGEWEGHQEIQSAPVFDRPIDAGKRRLSFTNTKGFLSSSGCSSFRRSRRGVFLLVHTAGRTSRLLPSMQRFHKGLVIF